MPFEDLMPVVIGWKTAAEALAALGAQLSLDVSGESAPPEIASALERVLGAAGLGDLDDIAPQQKTMVVGLIKTFMRSAIDLLDEPTRSPGWTFTHCDILDGFGRGSMMVPPLIAGSHPDLAQVNRFLDVGTGVGLLAVSAANVWPDAEIVGIDPWEPSLERARKNVAGAGFGDRITLRRQTLGDLDDTDAYDCAWVPTFFVDEASLEEALPRLVGAMRPGGWIAFGRFHPGRDPLADATDALTTIRAGGSVLSTDRAIELLTAAGCASVHAAPPAGPAPLELVLGQRPA